MLVYEGTRRFGRRGHGSAATGGLSRRGSWLWAGKGRGWGSVVLVPFIRDLFHFILGAIESAFHFSSRPTSLTGSCG